MIQVIGVSALVDNYIWLITNEARQQAAIVDPVDAKPVIQELGQREMRPVAILITHPRSEQTGSIAELLEAYPGTAVYGPANETIEHVNHPLAEGDGVELDGLGLKLSVLDIPGHTAGHIAYHTDGHLFCGNTLSGSGCGRVIDGTMSDLHNSLHRIAQLPPETLVYCANEYTVENIGFAKWVEPSNADLDKRLEECWELLDAGRATVPFRLEDEFKSNPFLRTHIPEVIQKIEQVAGRELSSPAEVFAAMRIWKDTEYD